MRAELLLETAAETDALSAVVSEGAGYRSIREQLSVGGAGTWLLLPHHAMTSGTTAIFANQGPPPNLKDLVGRIAPRPLFLIYPPDGTGGEQHLTLSTRQRRASRRQSGQFPARVTRAGWWCGRATTSCG